MTRPAIPQSTLKKLTLSASPKDILARLQLLEGEGRLNDEHGASRLSEEEGGITTLLVDPEVTIGGADRKFVGIKETSVARTVGLAKKTYKYVYHDGANYVPVDAGDAVDQSAIQNALITAANAALVAVEAVAEVAREDEAVAPPEAEGAAGDAAEPEEEPGNFSVKEQLELIRKVKEGAGDVTGGTEKGLSKTKIGIGSLPSAFAKAVQDDDDDERLFHIDFADEEAAKDCQKRLNSLKHKGKAIIKTGVIKSKQSSEDDSDIFGTPKKVSTPSGAKFVAHRLSFSPKDPNVSLEDFFINLILNDDTQAIFKKRQELRDLGNPRREKGTFRDEFHIAELSEAKVHCYDGSTEVDHYQVAFSDHGKAEEFRDKMAALRKANGDKLLPDQRPNPNRQWGQFWKSKTIKDSAVTLEEQLGTEGQPSSYVVKFKPKDEKGLFVENFADELASSFQAREFRRKQFKRDIEGTGGRDDYTKAVLTGNWLTLGIPILPVVAAAVGGALRLVHAGFDKLGLPGSAAVLGPASRMFLDAAEDGFRHGNLLSGFGKYDLANACKKSSEACAKMDQETLKYAFHPGKNGYDEWNLNPKEWLRCVESAVVAPAIAAVGLAVATPINFVATTLHIGGDQLTKGCRAMWEWTKAKAAEGGPMAVIAPIAVAAPVVVAGVAGYLARGLGIICRNTADVFASTAKNIDPQNRGLLGLAGPIGRLARKIDTGCDMARLALATPVARARARREASIAITGDEGVTLELEESRFAQSHSVPTYENFRKLLNNCALDVRNPKFNAVASDDKPTHMSLGEVRMRDGSFYEMLVSPSGEVSIKDTSLGAANNCTAGQWPDGLKAPRAKQEFYDTALKALRAGRDASAAAEGADISLREFKEQYGKEADAARNLKELFEQKGCKEVSPGCYEVTASDKFFETKKMYEVRFDGPEQDQIFLEKKGKARGEAARVKFSADDAGNPEVSMKLFNLVKRLTKMKNKDGQETVAEAADSEPLPPARAERPRRGATQQQGDGDVEMTRVGRRAETRRRDETPPDGNSEQPSPRPRRAVVVAWGRGAGGPPNTRGDRQW